MGWPRACARLSRRWRTEAPMLRGRSGIVGRRHDAGLHRGPHARGCSFARDLRRRGLALSQRLAQALDGKRIAYCSTLAKEVGHRLGNAKHGHGRAGDLLARDTALQKLVREPGDADRRVGEAGAPVLASDGDPDLWRHLLGQAVDRQSRGQADDAFGLQPRHLGQRLLWVEGAASGRW